MSPSRASARAPDRPAARVLRLAMYAAALRPSPPRRPLLLLALVAAMGGLALGAAGPSSASRYFVRQPEGGLFYIRTRPKRVSCVVEFGVEANIVCNDRPVPADRVMRRNVTRGVEISADVGNEDVKKFGNRITCRCIATKLGSNDLRVYNSRFVSIVKAYLNRTFGINPKSQRVPLGTTVRLRCEPPPGDPKPRVFWTFKYNTTSILKRFRKFRGRYQLMMTDLIIKDVKLSDTGYYTCVAGNRASYRYSKKAFLQVFDDTQGKWSEWSNWSTCTTGSSFRLRNCQATPGKTCRGPLAQSQRCTTTAAPTESPVRNIRINAEVRVGRQSVIPTTPSGCAPISSKQYSSKLTVVFIYLVIFVQKSIFSCLLE